LKIFILALFISGFIANSFAQVTEEWVRKYNGPANSFDIVSRLKIDGAGNVYVYGTSSGQGTLSDFVIIKYKPTGEVIWTQRYNSPTDQSDQINSACIDNAGNSYITGFTTDSTFTPNVTTCKYDSSGNMQWLKVFILKDYTTGFGQDITIDNSGNVIVAGFMRNAQSNYDCVTIKYTKDGDQIRSTVYDGSKDDIAVSLATDNADNIIIATEIKNQQNNFDAAVIKYDSSGLFKFVKAFNGSRQNDDKAASVLTDDMNNIFLCGSTVNTQSSLDYFYAKLDPAGVVQWTGDHNGTGNDIDIALSMAIDAASNIYITGYSRSDTVIGSEDMLTMKINSSGNVQWRSVHNGTGNGIDQGNSVQVDNSGNVFVGGASDIGGASVVYALLKYSAQGALTWKRTYQLANQPEDFLYSVTLNNSDIYVTGIALDSLTDFDIVTVKYSQQVGIVIVNTNQPEHFTLDQNYPNPFNPVTNLGFGISELGLVTLKIYDIRGKETAVLVNEVKSPGSYQVEWDAADFPSGVYFYTLETPDFKETKRMMLLK